MSEEFLKLGEDEIKILTVRKEKEEIAGLLGETWTKSNYCLIDRSLSLQQAQWLFTDRPKAEAFWPDVDVVYSPAESYVPTARARSMVTLHDAALFESEAHERGYDVLKQQAKWRILFHKLNRKVDLFHVVSQFSAERLAHFFPSMATRFRVVPNAVNDRFFEPTSSSGDAVLGRLSIAQRQFIFVPGGLSYRKNAELILAGWQDLRVRNPELLLVVCGRIAPPYRLAARAFGDSVKLAGFVTDEELCSLYQAAAVVWFPSRYEGFGIPVLEAMAAGGPVVTSNASALPEVAGEAALLVGTQDRAGHVAAIEMLLADGTARSELIGRGRRHVKERTWASSATRLREHLVALA
jgi:glycosyltransferase involved in cell wall biosynthesis